MKQSTMKRIPKNRILSVTVKRMLDDSPDTSWLGEYSNTAESEFSIDRAHSEDCNSVTGDRAKLDRVAAYVDKLAQEEQDCYGDSPELESLHEAWDTLRQIADYFDDCDCGERGDMGRHECRYFNPSFNYVKKDGTPAEGLTPEEVRKYTRQDYDRMESLNRGDFCFIGIRAEAEFGIPQGQGCLLTQKLSSAGLWGIESDSDEAFIKETENGQLSELRDVLRSMGFTTRAISAAFKNVKEEEN